MQIPIMRCPICNCEIKHTTLQESESKGVIEMTKAVPTSFPTEGKTLTVAVFNAKRQCQCGATVDVTITGIRKEG